MAILVKETDDRVNIVYEFDGTQYSTRSYSKNSSAQASLKHWLSDLFLPTGYPHSVSPDYLRYQIWNAIQACCSSVAGLLASRAVLEGFGVGKESSSATNAMLVTVVQDVFSRVTTIVAAYFLGTSLFPEAKTYRLLADVLNDLAVVCDVVSPHLDDFASLFTSFHFGSSLRITALCMSGCLRALCGTVAGGSKAALTLHFATTSNGTGDVGDLNAKDGSKETVLVLVGLLCGTTLLPYITTVQSTYITLFLLLACHFGANFIAVRGLAMRTLNRQRASIAWNRFRGHEYRAVGVECLTPAQVASSERIFTNPARVRDAQSAITIATCTIGCSFSSLFEEPAHAQTAIRSSDIPMDDLLELLQQESYILWYTKRSNRPSNISVALRAGHSPIDHLKAWAHAVEVANRLSKPDAGNGSDEKLLSIRDAYLAVEEAFPEFIEKLRSVGWAIDEGSIVVGLPSTIVVQEDGRKSDK